MHAACTAPARSVASLVPPALEEWAPAEGEVLADAFVAQMKHERMRDAEQPVAPPKVFSPE